MVKGVRKDTENNNHRSVLNGFRLKAMDINQRKTDHKPIED